MSNLYPLCRKMNICSFIFKYIIFASEAFLWTFEKYVTKPKSRESKSNLDPKLLESTPQKIFAPARSASWVAFGLNRVMEPMQDS